MVRVRSSRRVGTALVAVLILLLAGAGGAAYGWVALARPYKDFPNEGVFVSVPRGASRRTVSRILERQGVIRSSLVFELYCRRHPRRTLIAGDYFFDHAVTAREVFDLLANGRVYVKNVTVPEGYTMMEIAALLEHERLVSREAFLAAAQDTSLIGDLAPRARNLEGFLFPATYPFPRHPAPQDVVAAMVRRFRDTWMRLSAETGADGRSVEEVTTLASLIEKETPQPEEKPLVAAVFLNRLRFHRPLQCDPTILYALELAGRNGGPLTTRDLRLDSPYNTYRHTGLPPGPIASPGEASLRAALSPAKSDYLYFVANLQGGHFFSRTLAEHNRNVRRYRQLLAQANGTEEDLGQQPPPPAHRKRQHRKGAR
jgi:UPF0755 protein